jgi:hypothetical protein
MKINVHAPRSEKNDYNKHYSNRAVADMDTAPHDLNGIGLCVNMAFQLIIPRLQSFLGRRQVFGNPERFIKRYSKRFADRRDGVNRRRFRKLGKEVLHGGQRYAGSVGNVLIGHFQFFFTDSTHFLDVHLRHLNFFDFRAAKSQDEGLSNHVERCLIARLRH